MSRPRSTLKKVCLYLARDMLKALNRLRDETGVPVSVSVRKAIVAYVNEKRKEKKNV